MEETLKKKYSDFQKNNGKNVNSSNSQATRVFDTFNSALKEFYGKIINDKSNLIDLGCGNGSFVKVIKEKNINVKGYDLDTINLETSEIPETSNSIDYVTCISLIEHMTDPSNLLKEIYRILKSDGVLIIVTPNFYYSYKNFYDDPTHVNPFTPEKLLALLKLFNFKNSQILPWIVKKNPKIWRLPMKFFFSRYFLFTRGDSKIPIPEIFKGQSRSILSLSKK